jgi:hypothetical protein
MDARTDRDGKKLLLLATDRDYFLGVTIPLQVEKSVIRQLPG